MLNMRKRTNLETARLARLPCAHAYDSATPWFRVDVSGHCRELALDYP